MRELANGVNANNARNTTKGNGRVGNERMKNWKLANKERVTRKAPEERINFAKVSNQNCKEDL